MDADLGVMTVRRQSRRKASPLCYTWFLVGGVSYHLHTRHTIDMRFDEGFSFTFVVRQKW